MDKQLLLKRLFKNVAVQQINTLLDLPVATAHAYAVLSLEKPNTPWYKRFYWVMNSYFFAFRMSWYFYKLEYRAIRQNKDPEAVLAAAVAKLGIK